MQKQPLTIKTLISCAKEFCEQETQTPNKELFGITDGKAVGTYIEHKFKDFLLSKYDLQWRLQYGRIVTLKDTISGITKIIDKY